MIRTVQVQHEQSLVKFYSRAAVAVICTSALIAPCEGALAQILGHAPQIRMLTDMLCHPAASAVAARSLPWGREPDLEACRLRSALGGMGVARQSFADDALYSPTYRRYAT
jgi:hypothetical protein